MTALKDNKGLTLIELLVAMAIASIVGVVIGTAYQVQVRGSNTQNMLTDMNQSTRTALEIMGKELRTAACDPLRTAGAQLLVANANQLSFDRDIVNTAGNSFAPDGLLNGPNELLAYGLYVDGDGNQNLGRAAGGGAWQPLIRNVDALDFVYLDQNGNPTGTIADMRSVEVTVVARAGAVPAGLSFSGLDVTQYRNQQNNIIYIPPAGDRSRRFLLTSTVNFLNLW